MLVEDAIILSAGKGTRMGPIGKILAKPVWPYFGKTLLELQVEFLRQYGVKNFYINSHHLHEQLKFLESETVKIVHEPVLLDQGGGVLNIMNKFDLWSKPIIVNNADQLYFVPKKSIELASEKLLKSDVVLFGLNVKKGMGYNQLSYGKNKKISGIIKNNESLVDEFQTYSGMALLRCEKQKYEDQVLPFFKSVADLANKQVLIEEIDSAEYYDFGKLDSYFCLCFETLKQVQSRSDTSLIRFLKSIDVDIDPCIKGLNFSKNSRLEVIEKRIRLDEGEIFLKNGLIESTVFLKK